MLPAARDTTQTEDISILTQIVVEDEHDSTVLL